MNAPAEQFVTITSGQQQWEVDVGFMASPWRCIWGAGCAGIGDEPQPELMQGCCSVGAELLDDDEARVIAALGLSLDPAVFQYAESATSDGVLAESPLKSGRAPATRVVDGACIFLNRPGFGGGAGCALHLSAVAEDESPLDWKPAVCWQLPLKVDIISDGTKRLRRWKRADWGEGAELAWWCTEGQAPSAYAADNTGEGAGDGGGPAHGEGPFIERHYREVAAIAGDEVADRVRQHVIQNEATPKWQKSPTKTG